MSALPDYVHEAVHKVEGVASNVKADFLKLFEAVHVAAHAEVEKPAENESPGDEK